MYRGQTERMLESNLQWTTSHLGRGEGWDVILLAANQKKLEFKGLGNMISGNNIFN